MGMHPGHINAYMLNANPSEWEMKFIRDSHELFAIGSIELYANPCAVDMLRERGDLVQITHFNADYLARNPNDAIWDGSQIPTCELLRLVKYSQCWSNPNPSVWKLLCNLRTSRIMRDPFNPMLFDPGLLHDEFYSGLRDGDWEWLHKNTNDDAVALLRAHPERIDLSSVQSNPKWIDWYLDAGHPVTRAMSSNPHPRAIAAMREHPDLINWDDFSANPGIFEFGPPSGLRDALLGLSWARANIAEIEKKPSSERIRRLLARRRYIVSGRYAQISIAWPILSNHKRFRFKRVTRAKYDGDRQWQFPFYLAWIIKGYAEEEREIWIENDGSCNICEDELGRARPCDWHDEPHPNPDYREITPEMLTINIIAIPPVCA
jgi:hypothetical protein